jgi:NADP-dependent 3-hydroxy acid dehydrogenase YdfG
MKKIKSKVIVITGAGSGIGRALAVQCAKEGAKLALNDFDKKGLDETIALLEKTEVISDVFDVSNREAFYSFAEQVISHFKEVDIVINNAGVSLGKQSVIQTPWEEFEWIMNINLWGVINGSKIFLPYLMKQKEASLVNVSSVFGLMGIADQTPYCTTKYAVRGFTESLRMEMLEENVNVISVHPGGIKTNIARNGRGWGQVEDKEKMIALFEKETLKHTPEKAANIIISGIKKNKEKVLIGSEAYVIDWASRLSPLRFPKFLFKQMKKKMNL